MSKLLFIGSFPSQSQGGTSTASILLKEAFEQLGWEVFAVDSTLRDNRHNGLVNRIKRGLQRRKEIIRILQDHTPDHAFIMCGHGLSFLEKGFWMRVLQSKGLSVGLAPRSGLIVKSLRNPLFTFIFKRIILKADLVFCQGRYWSEFYARFDPKEPGKFRTLHNWVSQNDKSNSIEHRIAEVFRVAVVGWITRDKGLYDLPQIAQMVRSYTNKPFRVDVYGKGPDEDELTKLILDFKLSEVIRIHNWKTREEMSNILSGSDCLLFLSKYEGMANTLLEAQVAGLPIIATNVSTNPELVKDGWNGRILDSGNRSGFAKALVELMNSGSLFQEMSTHAARNAESFPSPMESAEYIAEQLTVASFPQVLSAT